MRLDRDRGVGPVGPGAVHIGLGEPIHQANFRRGERLETGGGAESLQGEGPPRTVPDEPLETLSVLALDPERSSDGASSGTLPLAHVRHRGGVQKPTSREPAQDAELHRRGQGFRIWGVEARGFVEPDSVLDVAGDHAVEGQDVVVVVRI
jgi:hypothetical protein